MRARARLPAAPTVGSTASGRCRSRRRLASETGREERARPGRPSRRWRLRRLEDARGERGAVEAVRTQRLGRRAARRPAVDAEDDDVAASSSRRSASPRPPTGAWSSSDEDVLERPSSIASHSASKRLSQGMSTTREAEPRSASSSAAVSASWSITGPYASRTRVGALAQHACRVPASSVAVELDPPRRGPDREPDRDVSLGLLDGPAQERPRLLGVRRAGRSSCPGSAASSEMSRRLLVRLPRPGRDQPRVVEGVDDLRPLARLVVDLLVRARGEEATRTS